MKVYWMFAFGVAVGALAVMTPKLATHLNGAHSPFQLSTSSAALEHAESKFEFTAKGPLELVAPLFGADRERAWAPGWHPEFVYPTPAADVQGMVFNVRHGNLNSTWVNTEFDLKAGRVQYAYMIPNALVTFITIQLSHVGSNTHVAVQYDRTALSADANAHVRHLAENDRKSGPEWEKQINEYLAKAK
jgi:hypothetical protein